VDAEAQRSTVAAHLRGIDERITQAIDMLARLPRFHHDEHVGTPAEIPQ